MQSKFTSLDTFLSSYQAYWRLDPFHLCQVNSLPWSSANPSLNGWLNSLDASSVQSLKSNPNHLIEEIECFIPMLEVIKHLCVLPELQLNGLELPKGADAGIPGRKLTQILAMGEAALHAHEGSEWLEWCAGKGFLGRILSSQSQQKVTSFEWQNSLCISGQAEADKQGLNMQFVQGDAFSHTSDHVFNSCQHAVALHACGDLHVGLLKKVTQHALPAVSISPCCYHLIQSEHYIPLSERAKQSELELSKSDLRIPLQETVTGGERVKRHRQLEMTFRLGLCQLLKTEVGIKQYIPIPSIKKSQLAEGFKAFCQWAAAEKEITLPTHINFGHYQQLGEALFWEMEKLSLVQQVFRRPLELWLALDRGMYLQEQGYQVSISQFCNKTVTPRNILIHARK
ncbi:methyltransferase [Vibrio sp. 99-70-13A1]|uniref:methyltransferase n=1 Tax=Vibrio sp. 99-70-13A1 TaxID=2607601 RepID=UPI0014932A32|nr:methyltransferase [Vibrio sp. 99-70-13A1]NOH96738.1 methyltransferase [Vibrio sp. 99-70-13A1]